MFGVLLLLGTVGATSGAGCADCHREIAASYAKTGMGRSFSRPTAARVPRQDKPYFHAASATYFQVLRRGDEFWHRRWQEGFAEEAEELRIDFVMGSGNHALTFLHRDARGGLIELPLGWYAEKGGYFAMNPGFDHGQPAMRRKIDYDCMGCHNAAPRIPARNAVPGAEPLYAGALPEGIGCERCHGPGENHMAAAKTGPVEAIRKAIVNPARLPLERQREVCMQCHLETTSERLPSMIRRFERAPFTYVPGEPLETYMLHFDHAGRADKFEIVSAGYRLGKSACFRKSEAMTCTSCHDPHARKVSCGGCHSPASLAAKAAHPAGADCAGCHMPKRRTEDAVHVVVTDHFVQRRPAVEGGLAERAERTGPEYQGEVVPYYPAVGMDSLYAAAAQVLHGTNLVAGIPRLEAEVAVRKPKEAEFYVTLGNAWQQAVRPEKAAEAFRRATALAPERVRPWRYLGIALQEAGRRTEAEAALRRALTLDPGDAVSWHQLGLLDSGAGRIREAAEKAAKAVALDPDLLDARNSLGASLAALGDRAGAEKAFRDALRVDPYFATAQGNLARLLATKGDNAGALTHFARAVRLRPEFAPDRHEYALALVRAQRFAEARTEVDAALRAAPALVEARILSGGLWAREGKLSEARRDYEEALRTRPDSGRAHLDLARVLIAQGDREGTVRHLRLAAGSADAASAEMARQALRNIGAGQ